MAKTNATRRSQRQSKVVTSEDMDEAETGKAEGQTETEIVVGTKEDAAKEDQDHQMDTAIEVKGNTPTVTISWDKKNQEGEVDTEKGTNASDQMMDSADAVKAPTESAEIEMQKSGVAVKGKRKAHASVETTPSKKAKLLNDGFCLYVGNLNNTKTFDEIKESLANYFTTQSLLVQDIRLDRSKKHAFVDFASELDLTKGLSLNGKMIHDKPLKVAKAKVKSEDKAQVKAPAKSKADAKDERCLFLKNIPFNTTKKEILKIFCQAVDVRFPDGTEGPTKGIAFVEFKNKAIAQKVREQKQGVEIEGRILIVDCAGKTNELKGNKANGNKKDTKAAAAPNSTLFVSNLPFNMKEIHLKKVFQTAVSISVPTCEGQSKGFAFVEFAALADAEKALQSSQNMKMYKKIIRVQFSQMQSEQDKVQSKTLIVMGLAEKTTAVTLKSAFEGSFSARVIVDKDSGVSKRFGFVDFESEDNCKAVKEAMEDCEIDGSKVTVAYAKATSAGAPPPPGGQPAGQGAAKAGRKRKGGRGKRKGKGAAAGGPQDAVKEVEIKV